MEFSVPFLVTVSHYPVLLFANTSTEEQPPSVVWKTSSNVEPREFEDATGDREDCCKPPRSMTRCVSTSGPVTALQRKELWGSALHRSFEKNTASTSSDSLYNSCTDLDTE
ncbi:hypothetical protein TELCIR_11913, partial [Teladorsagia circumcincta]